MCYIIYYYNGGIMNKTTAIIVGIVVLAFGGFMMWSLSQNQSNRVDFSKYDGNTLVDAGEDSGGIPENVKGNRNAPVLIIEYFDFQCGGCAQVQSHMERLVEEYGDKLGIIFRNFPLPGHQNSIAAASAAEAAGLQGLYFEMVDLLFKNQSVWAFASAENRTEIFAGYFDRLGGDRDRFLEDMASRNVRKKIDFDQGLGRIANVGGTPTFFLDGKQIEIVGVAEEEFLNAFRVRIDAKLRELGLEPGGVRQEVEEGED
jgi:predicted DsbA family dithiol-disulfide isomerase